MLDYLFTKINNITKHSNRLTVIADATLSRSEPLFIKAIVGLPGDDVVIPLSKVIQSRHKLLVEKADHNGNLIWHIPTEYCFVKGQSNTSIDSIIWGPIPIKTLIGVVCLKLPFREDKK